MSVETAAQADNLCDRGSFTNVVVHCLRLKPAAVCPDKLANLRGLLYLGSPGTRRALNINDVSLVRALSS